MKWTRLAAVMLVLVSVAPLGARSSDFKEQAKIAYEQEKYPEAIALARQATRENPGDAEAWFLLGWYTHYRAYDSRPWSGFGRATSDTILSYLAQAVNLDPKLGDAFYFIGAEHGARFEQPFCEGNLEQARAELTEARSAGAFPDWMIEYCRNVLRACDQDAILFLTGDLQVNGVRYLQLIEGYRPDVTAVPWPLMDRAGVVLLYKVGIPDALVPAPISWSREQILDIHPCRWRTDTIQIPVASGVLQAAGIAAQDSILSLEVRPDLEAGDRPMLSSIRALALDIIETNQWRRPVQFALGPTTGIADIDSCLQSCGLTQRLLPVRASKRGLTVDTLTIKRVLLDSASYRSFATVKDHDMPRVSPILNTYRAGLVELATCYAQSGNRSECCSTLDRMAALLPESVYPMWPDLAAAVKRLRPGKWK
jgi:tetratricopeptide (TPR) repeat protein